VILVLGIGLRLKSSCILSGMLRNDCLISTTSLGFLNEENHLNDKRVQIINAIVEKVKIYNGINSFPGLVANKRASYLLYKRFNIKIIAIEIDSLKKILALAEINAAYTYFC
jgi:hypothetical protein